MSSEKSSWPGVSSRLKTVPSYSKVMTEVTTEMPRARSIDIQSERVRRRSNVRVRSVDMSRFDAELDILKVIYRSAWAENWGFVPPTDAEIRQLALDLKPIVEPEAVIFAEVDGVPVACAVCIPDVNQVLARMNGGLFVANQDMLDLVLLEDECLGDVAVPVEAAGDE